MCGHSEYDVVLIRAPSGCVDDDRLEPPLGLLYLAAVLRERRLGRVAVFDLSGVALDDRFATALEAIPSAPVYALSVVCTNHVASRACVDFLHKRTESAFIVAGGPNPTALPELSRRDLHVDLVVAGEGEDAFADLVEAFQGGERRTGVCFGAGRRDPDTYPFPARDLIDHHTYTKTLLGQPSAPIISSRGCPYSCMHCNSTVMGGGSRDFRCRSAANIVSEVEQLIYQGYHHMRFCDDNFTANPNLPELLERLSGLDIRFRVFARLDAMNSETCRALRNAGCVHVTVGLESLNPDNLRAIGKGRIVGLAHRVSLAKQHGLTVRVSFMVGLPFDTDDGIERYFQAAAELPFDEFEVHPLIPFPGTPVSCNPSKWGYQIETADFRDYVLVGRDRATTYALRHRNFSPSDVRRWRKRAGAILRSSGKVFMRDSLIAR